MPAARNADLAEIISDTQAQIATLNNTFVARWGRVPHVLTDPTPLVDGMVWIRGDLGKFCFRANGSTVRVP